MAAPADEFISPTWTAKNELRLVNGVWVSVPTGIPVSSSAALEQPRKPRSLREKKAMEEAEKAAQEAAEAAAAEQQDSEAGNEEAAADDAQD